MLHDDSFASKCLIGINQVDNDQYRLFAADADTDQSLLSHLSAVLIDKCHYQLGMVAYEASLLHPSVEALIAGSCIFFERESVPAGLAQYQHRLMSDHVLVFTGAIFGEFVKESSFCTDRLLLHLKNAAAMRSVPCKYSGSD